MVYPREKKIKLNLQWLLLGIVIEHFRNDSFNLAAHLNAA